MGRHVLQSFFRQHFAPHVFSAAEYRLDELTRFIGLPGSAAHWLIDGLRDGLATEQLQDGVRTADEIDNDGKYEETDATATNESPATATYVFDVAASAQIPPTHCRYSNSCLSCISSCSSALTRASSCRMRSGRAAAALPAVFTSGGADSIAP